MNLSNDRIAQGRFFLNKVKEVSFSDREVFLCYIEASIIVARNVTFLLQKQYHNVTEFDKWYSIIQAKTCCRLIARFLLEKRNFVLKEGIISIKKVVNVNINATVRLESSVTL